MAAGCFVRGRSPSPTGVLFLDEAPEFAAGVLDALRQPLESGYVEIARAAASARFPARVQLVLAANPCPCAPAREVDCTCSATARRRYLGRLSGALLDRIDVRQQVAPISRADLLDGGGVGEPTSAVAARVSVARGAAAERWGRTPYRRNADVSAALLRRPPYALTATALRPAAAALDAGRLSARGFHRVLRVAWSVADLTGRDSPGPTEVAAAMGLRCAPGLPVAVHP